MTSSAPISDEVREAIHEAMAALDDESRALVIEHYFEKATLDEMGARRGMTGAAIWKRIEGIKGKLRHGLALAGLAAAASKAEACLEAATLVAPGTNLVGASTIAGGLMASKATTITVAVVVATVTFGAGLGGGLAIQAARTEPRNEGAVRPPEIRLDDRVMVTKLTKAPLGLPETPEPVVSPDDRANRLQLAETIWTQLSRPRFWKDRDAQDETLPKLKHLGADLAEYFIERFREKDLTRSQSCEAIRLALACGGPKAADLMLELAVAQTEESRHHRIAAIAGLGGGFTNPPRDFPMNPDLWAAATVLQTSDRAWDRVLAMQIFTYGKSPEWSPILTELVRTDASTLVRVEVVKLLAQRGDAAVLAFLREQKRLIATIPFQYSAAWVEQEQAKLERCVDESVETLEGKLKR